MSKYSAYEDQHYNCNCCQEDAITCKPVTVVTTTGKVLGEAEAGEKFKVGDSIITNSNQSYTYPLPATVDLELPDIPHVDSNGDIVPTPAQVPFVCTTVSVPSNVINTDGDLIGQTDPPDDFVVPDTDYEVYLDGVLEHTGTMVTLGNETLNITT